MYFRTIQNLSLTHNYDSHKFFNCDTICDGLLEVEPNQDFRWTTDRTIYAFEWGLICSKESKLSNLRSVFFTEAFLGLLMGTVLFDKIGRRATTLLGIILTILSCLGAIFVNSYYSLSHATFKDCTWNGFLCNCYRG